MLRGLLYHFFAIHTSFLKQLAAGFLPRRAVDATPPSYIIYALHNFNPLMLNSIILFFKQFDWSWSSLLKVAASIVFVLLVLSVISSMFFGSSRFQNGYGGSSFGEMAIKAIPPMPSFAPSLDRYSDGMGGGYGYDAAVSVESQAMLAPQWIPQTVNGGRNSEQFEREGYSAQYESRNIEKTCSTIESLKPKAYVLFDSANQSEYGCDYAFRVEKAKADEIVSFLKELHPKTWSTSVVTVAQGIEDSKERIAILKTRLQSLNDTLIQVERSYNQLVALATRNEKVGDLATILNNKLTMIERLTNDKLSLEEQIRQATGGSEDQIDETAYTHFSVSVQKVTIVDWKQIKDNWRNALQSTVYDISQTLSWIIFFIPALLVTMLWYGIVIALVVLALTVFVKLLWRVVVKIWND